MKNYQKWYDKGNQISLGITALQLMRVFNRILTVLMPLAYLTLLGASFISKEAGKDLTTCHGADFWLCLVTLVRKWINQPRHLWGLGNYPATEQRIVQAIQCPAAASFIIHHFHGLSYFSNLPVGLILLNLSALLGLGAESWVAFIIPGCSSRLCLWAHLEILFFYFVKKQSKWAWPQWPLTGQKRPLAFIL